MIEAMSEPGPVLLALALGALAAASNLLGGRLALLRPPLAERHLLWGLAFSGGFLLAVALLLVLPECVGTVTGAPWLIAGGYFLVYLAEHLFAGHAHHVLYEPHGAHPLIGAHVCEDEQTPIRRPAATAAAAGLILHSFFDGAAIAAALDAGHAVGWLTFLAVVLHKVPEGFSLASIALSARRTARVARGLTLGLGLASLAGTAAALLVGRLAPGASGAVLAVACGMFIHISATDLLPTTSHVRGLRTLAATAAGAGLVVVVALLFHASGH